MNAATKIGLVVFITGLVIFGCTEYAMQTTPLALDSNSWCSTMTHIEPNPTQTMIILGLSTMLAGCGLILAGKLGCFTDQIEKEAKP